MRWSLRNTLLTIVLPLTLATISMAVNSIGDNVTVRRDIEVLRGSTFRSIYAERYARNLQALLKEAYDHLAGRRAGLDGVTAARRGMVDSLDRLRLYVNDSHVEGRLASPLTTKTLEEWEQTRSQVDQYVERAIALSRRGESARAKQLAMNDLEVLAGARIFNSIDHTVKLEQALIEEYRVRVARPTETWMTGNVGPFDLRGRLLRDVYETILTERFLRSVYADILAFDLHLFEGRQLKSSHGAAASQTLSQLNALQPGIASNDENEYSAPTTEPAMSYALIQEVYKRTMALPAASRRSGSRAVARRLDDILDQSLVPHTKAIIFAREESIDRELERIDQVLQITMVVSAATALLALLIALGCPYFALRLLSSPIRDLIKTLSLVDQGQKNARADVKQQNELGKLGHALNGLLEKLEQSDTKLQSLAFYDSMTGLPNRQFFQECFEGVLVNARTEGCVVGLLTVRLEGMEQIRETLGRTAGDELIREIAARLRQTVRMSDVVSRQDHDPAETDIAHFGGDEFSILLNRIANPGDAAVAAQRVLTKVTAPILVDGHDMVLRASVGIGVYPQDGGDADTLLRNSTAAMSEAMNSGGNVYHFYAEAMNIANARKLNIQTRLRHAIRGNELELYFQPIAESKYGRITGAETLLRWVDSEIGPVPPKEFISIAEGCGLITEIGQWVLVAACAQVRAWQEAGFGDIRVSVNVSAKQLSEPDWASNVVETLRASGVSPGCIELEITETTIISDDAATIGALTELSGMGISIALDDFGTGYSSLAHLRQLPINRVKIDRSFVWEITKNASGASLCAAIVALAHCMQLEVVGEGVENHEQANFLRDCGCEELQGYMISRAVSAAEFERFLTRQKPE